MRVQIDGSVLKHESTTVCIEEYALRWFESEVRDWLGGE